MDKLSVLKEIKSFLDGYNEELKYLVNVEIDPRTNMADCVIHEPNQEKQIIKVAYEPFIYFKDFEKFGIKLFANNFIPKIYDQKLRQYGITITKLQTGGFSRLTEGFCYKMTSSKSMNSIMDFLADAGVYPYQKMFDGNGVPMRDEKGDIIYKYKDFFYKVSNQEQFFISTKSRLYKGIEEYKDIHKATFDIETTGLRYAVSRLFAIGIKDNRGYGKILELDKQDDDESEKKMITQFFEEIIKLSPAILCGYNSEDFDFGFIEGRSKILKLDITKFKTTLKEGVKYSRRANVSVKYGGKSDKYIATEIWGMSVIDIMHAAKRTQAINNEIKNVRLKYIASFENIAKPNRTYIDGSDGFISRIYKENKTFVIDAENNYMVVPEEFQIVARNIYLLQLHRGKKIAESQYLHDIKILKNNNPDFIECFRTEALPKNMITLISGKNILKNYLLDDLWETDKVDELYNQSSFMLAKIVPTTYQRICTMGTAAVWNLLMTAWSYEKNIAIPCIETKEPFSGGLARTFKRGFSEAFVKVDFSGLYPAIELTEDTFPMFDFTSGLKKMLLFSTTARNIYKRLANRDSLNENEILLLKEIDHDTYNKLMTNTITDADRAMFKVKQLPLKILNNSQFGALGSGIALNWSDSICAARITCVGRLLLRKSIKWFEAYGCEPLLAVTDGINFAIPKTSKIIIGVGKDTLSDVDLPIEEAWKYGDKVGMSALIDKYNKEDLANYRSDRMGKESYLMVDDDGQFLACINLSKINYATLSKMKNKKTGEYYDKVKLTGNTIKSKNMPEYIEEFIGKSFDLMLHGKGEEFVEYYYQYIEDIYYRKISLKKIARKDRINRTIEAYEKRGNDKNGRKKPMQGFMEGLVDRRKRIVEETFQKHKHEIQLPKMEEKLKFEDKYKLIKDFMPKEPEMDSYVYTVNIGQKQGDPDTRRVDPSTGKPDKDGVLLSLSIPAEEFDKNPDMEIEYNVKKYLAAFNKRVEKILVGFSDDVAKKILAKFAKIKVVGIDGKKTTKEDLVINRGMFQSSDYILKNYELDNVEKSMYLERKEVDFWNKYGYDPYLVWDGFSTEDALKMQIRTDVYMDALNFLNEKMLAVGKPLIKSLDDNLFAGDLVLIKNKFKYSLGLYNGEYFSIIRENVEVPKSQFQSDLELADKMEEETMRNLVLKAAEFAAKKAADKLKKAEEKLNKVPKAPAKRASKKAIISGDTQTIIEFTETPTLIEEPVIVEEVEDEVELDAVTKKHSKYLAEFLKRFNIEGEITLELIYSDNEAKAMFERYVADVENESDDDDYFDDDSDSYE